MEKQLAIRRVRITVSVFFGALTMAMCVLWVVSFWQEVHVTWRLPSSPRGNNYLWQYTKEGVVTVHLLNLRPLTYSSSISFQSIANRQKVYNPLLGFWYDHLPNGEYVIAIPMWAPILLLLVLGISCLSLVRSLRFSLRNLLVAATLVAVSLGLGLQMLR